jgi:hypothetical protein
MGIQEHITYKLIRKGVIHMLTVMMIGAMTTRLQQVYKPTGANIHTYTNKIASAIGIVQLRDMYIERGKDTTVIESKMNTAVMDMYKWIDKEYNRHLYV